MSVLIDYVDALPEQMGRARYRNGFWERLEGNRWVPWPVLRLDRLGRLEAMRCHGRVLRTEAA